MIIKKGIIFIQESANLILKDNKENILIELKN